MTNIQEIWKPIKNYEGLYEVSNLGRVKRLQGYQSKSDRIILPLNNGKSYLGVSLCKNSNVKRFYIHRLVLIAFVSNPENKPHANHKDGNRINNELSNLEWVSVSENHHHRYKVLKQLGVNHGKSGKLKGMGKKTLCVFNGCSVAVFNSMLHAANVLNLNARTINDAVLNNKMYLGYEWKRIFIN